MAASNTDCGACRSRGTGGKTLREIKPLPWPPTAAGRHPRAHAHRCTSCLAVFACPGPDDTGLCAPVCQPCYWVELGRQLRIYKAVVRALSRRRLRIERRIGSAQCRRAQAMRRRLDRESFLELSSGKYGVIHGDSDRAVSPESISSRRAG